MNTNFSASRGSHIAVLAGLSWISLVATLAIAAPLPFSLPAKLSGPPAATRVRIAAGPNGDFHVAYLVQTKVETVLARKGTAVPLDDDEKRTEDTSPRAAVMEGAVYYARYRDGSWSQPLRVSGPDRASVPSQYADVGGDQKGDGYVTFVDGNREHLVFATVRDATSVRKETRRTRHAVSANLVVDSRGIIRLMYRDKGPEENFLLSRRPTDRDWTSPQPVPKHGNPEFEFGQREFGLAAGTDGRVTVAYRIREKKGGPNRLGARVFEGERWLDEIIEFGPTVGKCFAPRSVVDDRGGLHTVWHHTRFDTPRQETFFYRRPDGREVRISEGFHEFTWQPSIAISPNGDVVVVRSSTLDYRAPDAAGKVEYFVKRGDNFSPPYAIDPSSAAPSSWGSVAATRDVLMMVWSSQGTIHYATYQPRVKNSGATNGIGTIRAAAP